MKNYYSILDVSRDADISAIKRAFRSKAMSCHPDRGGSDEEFQQINEAYSVLSNQEKKAEYDLRIDQTDIFDLDSFNEDQLVDDIIFGTSTVESPAADTVGRNADINLHITITFEESYFGKDIDATYPLLNGDSRTSAIQLPAGVISGDVVSYCGLGDNSDTSLHDGDLNIYVEVEEHDRYVRLDNDLVTIVKISPIESMIGTTKSVKHISGEKYDIDIYPGMKTGSSVTIEGLGFYNRDYEQPGDFICEIEIESVPVTNPEVVSQLVAIEQRLRKQRPN